mmetsp:Transcript_40695/g.96768  ORF Transcript_40695/g.96768 Transcript_40695/m.96768 type:complete len:340 (+) Transcript_40695:1326-2345(+)
MRPPHANRGDARQLAGLAGQRAVRRRGPHAAAPPDEGQPAGGAPPLGGQPGGAAPAGERGAPGESGAGSDEPRPPERGARLRIHGRQWRLGAGQGRATGLGQAGAGEGHQRQVCRHRSGECGGSRRAPLAPRRWARRVRPGHGHGPAIGRRTGAGAVLCCARQRCLCDWQAPPQRPGRRCAVGQVARCSREAGSQRLPQGPHQLRLRPDQPPHERGGGHASGSQRRRGAGLLLCADQWRALLPQRGSRSYGRRPGRVYGDTSAPAPALNAPVRVVSPAISLRKGRAPPAVGERRHAIPGPDDAFCVRDIPFHLACLQDASHATFHREPQLGGVRAHRTH